MAASASFRGIRGIEVIRDRMAKLVEFYKNFKPEVQELVLERVDYDLIERWPRAAHTCGFDVTDNGIFYEGFRLTYDTGQGRYVKQPEPTQAVIE